MPGKPAGRRVLVVVPTVDGIGTSDARSRPDTDDEPGTWGFASGDGGSADETPDRSGSFLRGGSATDTEKSRDRNEGGRGDAGGERSGDAEDRGERHSSETPTDPADPTPADDGSAGRVCDPEKVLAALEDELDAEVVVRCGRTATEYVSELGPTLDCVVVLGDDRELIHDLIEDGSVPTIVCEPPIIGRIDDAVAGEDSLGELVDRVRVELRDDRKQKELQESNARLTALSHYAEDITACETVDAVVERTVEATTDALAFDYCVVFLVEGERLVPRASALPEPEMNTSDVDDGIAGRTLARGESEIVEDIQSDRDAIPEHDDLHAGVSVPVGERGVIQVASADRDAFDERDREFVEILAGYTREALERIEREVTLRTERDRLHAFFGELPVPAVHVERRDGVTTVREVNRTYADRFGDVEPGEPLLEVVSSETEREQYEAALDTANVSADTVERESVDESREFALSVVPVSPPGSAECAYGIYIDHSTDLSGVFD